MTSAAIKDELLFSLRHPRVRASIAVFVGAVLLLVAEVIYWWPTSVSAEKTGAEIEARRQAIFNADLNVQLAHASGLAVQQVALIERKLEASATQAILVQNLEALARRHNIKIISEAYEEGKTKDGYSSFVHELTLQAGYPELRNFIVGIQGLPTFTVVQEAMLGSVSNSPAIRMQLNLITYRGAVGSPP